MELTLVQRGFVALFKSYGSAILSKSCALHVSIGDDHFVIGNPDARPEDSAIVQIHDASMFAKVVLRSDIGMGESYMDGSWESPDLYKLIEVLSRASCGEAARKKTNSALGMLGSFLFAAYEKAEFAAHRANSNTEAGSKRNIEYHYDAGNDFYKLFLDDTMMYSSGVHKGLLPALEGLGFKERERALEEAQFAKLDAMIARGDLQPGERVLEIGCGWGTMAIRMATRAKCLVTGITISKEQYREATARVKAAGLSDRIEIVICDYRRVHELPTYPAGGFDKVVSIEMLEAVGHEHLHSYFECVARYLQPGGLAAVQVICIPDNRYEASCTRNSDFIKAYIFPGSHLPCLGVMSAIASNVGLEVEGCANIGLDYAVTLHLWRERMMHRLEEVRRLGYPERFIRMYEFYFVYCEAGFANGLIHDYQITWRKSPLDESAPAAAKAAAAEPAAPLDRVTCLMLAIFGGLASVMLYRSSHMALIPGASLCFLALRTALASLVGMAPNRASTLTGIVAAVINVVGPAAVLLLALAELPAGEGVWNGLASIILQPTAPAPLLAPARLVAGAIGGWAAVRAWECARAPSQRSAWEAFGYAASLVCASAALYSGLWLAAVGPAHLCEAHSSLLRIRKMGLQAGRTPSATLWGLAWLAFVASRAVPHLVLLRLFLTADVDLASASKLAGLSVAASANLFRCTYLGLAAINLNNLAIAWGMARAQSADGKVQAIAEALEARPVAAGDAPPSRSSLSSPPIDPVCAALAVGAALLSASVTTIHAPGTRDLIGATSLCYAAAYAVLRSTGLLQPRSSLASPAKASEWRARVLSTANAVLIAAGSALCFSEWPYPGAEGWISDLRPTFVVPFASLFVGYLMWDLCWVLWHMRASPDVGSLVHHTLFIAITHYVLYYTYYKQSFAWLSACELSTPFLNARWFLAVQGRKGSGLYTGVSIAFALCFLLTRTLGYSLGVASIYAEYDLWRAANPGFYCVIAGTLGGWVLNCVWSVGVVAVLARSIPASSGGKSKAA